MLRSSFYKKRSSSADCSINAATRYPTISFVVRFDCDSVAFLSFDIDVRCVFCVEFKSVTTHPRASSSLLTAASPVVPTWLRQWIFVRSPIISESLSWVGEAIGSGRHPLILNPPIGQCGAPSCDLPEVQKSRILTKRLSAENRGF